MDELLQRAALAVTAAGCLIVATGTVRALRQRGWGAAVVLASALGLGLEFLLAAGLLRLSTLSLPALGVVAAVVAARQVIARGLRYARSAAAG